MTTLESVPLEEVLRDVLDGVKIMDSPQLEDLTPEHMALVMLRVQQMRRAKIKEIETLSEQVARAVKTATETRARSSSQLRHAGLPHAGVEARRRRRRVRRRRAQSQA